MPTGNQSDEQLIDEVVRRMREHDPNHVEAQNAMRLIREVFAYRPRPDNVVRRVMNKFMSKVTK